MAEARRFLALFLPRLATDRLARRDPTLHDRPCATWQTTGSARHLAAVNAAAERAGLSPGLPFADALAALPSLVALPAAPAADAAALRALATWASGFTPLAAPAPPDALLLDITGCAHLFGGEPGLLEAAAGRLRRAGFTVRAAMADTAAGALALARGSAEDRIVPPGSQAEAVCRLPLAALRLAPEAADLCARLGLETVGDLETLARGPAARRLGPSTLATLDEAMGRSLRPITPLSPTPPARAVFDCPDPLLTAEAIAIALSRLLASLCRDLAERGLGARRLSLACYRSDATVQRLGIGTAEASRDAHHLARLLFPKIERIDPGFGIERLVLAADSVEPLGAYQRSLPGPGGEAAARREALARLIDRLRNRLGQEAVFRLDPFPAHWPEGSLRAADPASPPRSGPWPEQPRPLRLLPCPQPLPARSPLPDGPPETIGQEPVTRAEGPERILPAWWLPPAGQAWRDYWRVETASGRRLWVFATGEGSTRAWFLHGRFG